MKKHLLTVLACAGCIAVCASSASFPQDSYVNALQSSHQTDFGGQSSHQTDYDDNGGGYQYNPPPSNNYLPVPTSPPAPVYGPPSQPIYGPPPPMYYRPAESIPYHSHGSWFLEKLKSKLSLYTVGKIILKLLIFKKIVKFIGLIFLLLVLPKLKNMFKDDTSAEEEGMESKLVETDKDKLQRHIEELFSFITDSIEDFEKRNV